MGQSDPDKLALSKRQVITLIDEFISELGVNKKDNWAYIVEAYAVKKIFGRVPDAKFPWFWERFWEKAERFRYANTVIGDVTLQKLPQGKKIVSELDFAIEKVLAKRG